MQVLKNRGTSSLLKSEKQSLVRFFILYLLMTTGIIVLIAIFYYQSQEKIMLSNKRGILANYAYEHIKKLKTLHHYFDERRTYPRDSRFKSAIYDLEYVEIFSLLDTKNVIFDKETYIHEDKIYFVKMLDEYYLGAKYLFLEIEDDKLWQSEAWRMIFLFGGIGWFVFALFGLYFSKLFLGPMRNSIMLLDRFIKDTTHELNTPLSTILANIEMMDTASMDKNNKKRVDRISTAAKTVSVLYNDLTYLFLDYNLESKNEEVDLKALLENRIEYFDTLAKSKEIVFEAILSPTILTINPHKITRVIDNLLSNAIKYNKRNGQIVVFLREGFLSISDTGIGINPEQIPYMFDRYIRFNQSEGGFGIGLSIVKKILDEYNISIEVHSKENQGATVVLRW
ncbi:MAG TPA: HAMP domain-containing histidine kinase [Epsilonproteobacteria bacterium]|nr:HAMP domain-containing histidine kinase [Campylobacterota bacterium]